MISSLIFSASLFTVGEITTLGDSDVICANLSDNQIIAVDSNGGNVSEFLRLGDYLYDKKINLVIIKAYSAAAYMVSGANKVCIFPESSIGYHSIHTEVDGHKSDITLNEMRYATAKVTSHMLKWGVDEQNIININYLSMITPPDDMTYLTGADIGMFIEDVRWCKGE